MDSIVSTCHSEAGAKWRRHGGEEKRAGQVCFALVQTGPRFHTHTVRVHLLNPRDINMSISLRKGITQKCVEDLC